MTIEEWLKFVLQSNVVAALVVGIFGIISLKLGLGKFRSEKWWERKSAAYISTIEAMHAMYTHSKAIVDEASSDYELNQTHRDKMKNDSLAGLMELRKAASIGPFLMSKMASQIVNQLVRELEEQDLGTEPVVELHRTEMTKVYDAIVALTREAKRDLRTP